VTTRHYIRENSATVRTWNLKCATSPKHGNERLGSMTDEEFTD
jgi:hypothetical protein